MIIQFETTQKVLYSFSLDPTEQSKFLHWQLEQDGANEKDILRYLESRDLPRQQTYFSQEIHNVISDEGDDE